jgi:hypothetical protein
MAGKTQFKHAVTVNLTDAQMLALSELLEYTGKSRQDVISEALAFRCDHFGIRWPKAEKQPPGRHKAERDTQGKFTKS